MRLERLLTADLGAIADRSRQEIQRSIDRLLTASGARDTAVLRHFDHLAPYRIPRSESRDSNPEPTRIRMESELEMFRRRSASRFFAGAQGSVAASYISEYLPESREHTLVSADALCEHRFSLLGHRSLYLGKCIDWHRDAISGLRAPFVHWSLLDPLDRETVGDSKMTWELNRHQWLLDLGQAYRFTGDPRYSRAAVGLIRDWMEANPPGIGINWSSSLEVSYRLIAWCWALNLLRDSQDITAEFHATLSGWIFTHAAHVEKYLSHYFSPNTHLTGEALGLFYAGVLFAEFPKAARWQRMGQRILLQQLERQVLDDGVYFEQSTCYQRYVAEIYLHYFVLASRNGMRIPESARERVGKLLDYLLAIRRPDGFLPQIGDTDGGSVLPLVRRRPDDARGIFSVAAALFNRADYAWASGGISPELLWLMGDAGSSAFAALHAAPPDQPASRIFPDGGYAVMQSSYGRNAHQLIFDAGPLGCPISGAHGHADLLSIQCTSFGEAQLIDAGTYCYSPPAEWRNHFRSTTAHSTVVVDGRSQALPAGPFGWARRPRASLHCWESDETRDFADASHDAYGILPDPVTHRRRVLFVKPRYWLIVDDLYGAEAHQIELLFQFGQVDVAIRTDGWAASLGPRLHGLFIRPFCASELQARINIGDVSPIRGWMSNDYGLRSPAPLLAYSGNAQLPLRIVTVLFPRTCADSDPPVIQPVWNPDSLRLAFSRSGEVISVSDADISASRTDVRAARSHPEG